MLSLVYFRDYKESLKVFQKITELCSGVSATQMVLRVTRDY